MKPDPFSIYVAANVKFLGCYLYLCCTSVITARAEYRQVPKSQTLLHFFLGGNVRLCSLYDFYVVPGAFTIATALGVAERLHIPHYSL